MGILFWLLEKHFWLVVIGVNFLNGFLLKERFKPYIQQNPSLEEGYVKIYRGSVIYTSLPFLVIGIGVIFGSVESISDFFLLGPNLYNPFILMFYVTLFTLWLLCAVWIFFLGGAEFLAEHPGVFKNTNPSPTEIKLYMTFGVAGIAIFIIIVFSGSFNTFPTAIK
jgi:hypothetical protein